MTPLRVLCIASVSAIISFNLNAQWIQQPTPLDSTLLLTIGFADTNVGCAAGYRFTDHPHGQAIYTSDGGSTWTQAQLPDSTWSIVTVRFVDNHTVYAAANRTTSTVITSKARKDILNRSSILRWSTIPGLLVRPLSAGLVGEAPYRGQFMKSTDAGKTWFSHGVLPDSVYYLIGASFATPQIGYITASGTVSAQEKALLLKTTDGGSNWSQMNLPIVINELRNILFTDSLKGFAVGFRSVDSMTHVGVIIHTLDGGESWAVHEFSDSTYLEDITFLDDSVGFAIGGRNLPGDPFMGTVRGIVYKTTDLGLNWSPLAFSPDSVHLTGIRFFGETGILFGFKLNSQFLSGDEFPFVARTTDRGETWIEQAVPGVDTGQIIVGGALLTETNGYLCGGNWYSKALILHTTNSGISFVGQDKSDFPKDFELLQNYPNPFNPKTSIEFSIAKTGFVHLRIYNILGEEVGTLVSQELHAGTYGANWDASGVSSGVYFIRLQVGAFTQSKKLVLLR